MAASNNHHRRGRLANPSAEHSRYREPRKKDGALVLPLDHGLPVPEVPEGVELLPHEQQLWNDLFSSPQSYAWPDDTILPVIVVYVRLYTALITGKAAAWQSEAFNRIAASCGMTPLALQQLNWVIEEPNDDADVTPLQVAPWTQA